MTDLKRLYIEPTSECNLQCTMCFRHTWFDEDTCTMPMAMFDRIMATLPGSVNSIVFGGMGEPMHHPDILNMVEKASSEGYRVELLTNGSLLSEAKAEALINAGLSRLWVSMDDIEPSDDDGLGHPAYDGTIKRLKAFNSLRIRKRAKVDLGITFVATKKNVHQLARLPYFIERYRVAEVNVSNMYPSHGMAQEETLYQRTVDMGIGSDIFGEKRPVVNIPYMDFELPEVRRGLGGMMAKMNYNLQVSNTPVPRRSQYCRFVSEGMAFVRGDGHVSPCMALLHNGTTALGPTERTVHHHSFGNVMDQGLEEIWQSHDYAAFRERVETFDFAPCMTCGHCDFPESNQEDCFGNEGPTCGACLWAEGLLSCP